LGGPQLRAQFTYSEDFKNSTAAGWSFYQGSSSPGPRLTSGLTGTAGADPEGATTIDPSGSGWLRLATATTQQANAVFFDTPIPSAGNQVQISFNVNLWGGNNFNGTGADGLTFFLYDAAQPFSVGAFGGSIGYAQKDAAEGADTTAAGMGGGYVGIALDAYGNFSRAAEGRNGGTAALAPNSVAIRGPGSGQDGYNYLAGTTGSNGTVGYDYTDTGSPTAQEGGDGVVGALPYTMGFATATERPNQSTQYRRVEFTLTETSQIIIRMQFGEDGLWYDVLNVDVSSFARPEQLRFGFSAGTGAGTQVYEVGNSLNITATAGSGNFVWDNRLGPGDSGGGTSIWGTGVDDPLHWAGQTNPTLKSNILFNSAYIGSAQNIDLRGSDKVAKNIYFSGPDAYTLTTTEARKIIMDSDTVGGLTTISLTSEVGGNAAHTIGVDLQLNKTLDINNTIGTHNFTLSGGIDTNGNALNFKGTGTTQATGVISGAGTLAKFDTGTTILSGASANTYTGATTVNAGTLQIEKAGALGSTASGTTVNTGGTLALAGAGATFAAEGLTLNGTGVGGNGALRNTAGDNTWTGTVNLASDSSVGVNPATTLTVSGVVSGASGNDLTKIGAGTLVLSGANTFAGATNINAGALRVSADNNLGAAPVSATANQLTLDTGTLNTTSTFTLDANRGVTLNAGGGAFDTNSATTLTYNGVVDGGGALNKAGAGTLTLGGANTYSGATNINAGTLTVGVAETLPNNTAVTIASGATLNTNGLGETVGSIAGAGSITLGSPGSGAALTVGGSGASTTFSGVISGGANADVVKTGAGTLTLSGANTFTGDLQVNQGTVALGANNTLSNSSTLVLNGGTFATYSAGVGYSDTIGNLTLQSSSAIDYGSLAGALTFTNGSRTAGTLTILGWAGDVSGGGASQLLFTNFPTGYNGTNPNLNDITFDGYGAGAIRLASGEIVPATGTVYTWNSAGATWASNANWDSTPDGFPGGAGHTAIFGSALTSDLTLSLAANRTLGYLTFNDNNNVTLQNNTLNFDVSAGAAQLNVSNTGSATISSAVTLSDALTINQNSTGTLTLSGIISNATGNNTVTVGGSGNTTISGDLNQGTGGLTKTGTGTLTLTMADSDYTGKTIINSGVLAISNEAQLGNNPGASISDQLTLNGGTLRTQTSAVTINDANREIFIGSAGGAFDTITNLTIANTNVMSGSGTVTKEGAGVLNLSATNTHTGDFIVNAGTLLTSGGSAIGNSALVTVNTGATWQTGASETVGNFSGSGSITFTSSNTLTFGDASNRAFSGVISDGGSTGNLSKAGTGTVTLSGANTYDGATAITAGALNIQNSGGLGSTTGSTTVSAGAALELQGGIAVGAEALGLSGAGVSTNGALRNVSDANSYAGNITLNADTEIQSDAGTLTLTGTINGSAASRTLTLDGAGNITASNALGANLSTLTKNGAGYVTLSGNNAYTGATTINAGTLEIQHANALGTAGAATTVANGATLALSNNITSAEALTLQGQGVGSLGAVRNLSGGNTLSGALTLSAETYFGVDGASTLTASGAIGGAAGLTKTGSGTLIFSNANTYTGTTAVEVGTLEVRNNTALGTTNATTVSSGATLAFSNNVTAAENITLTGSGVSNAGALQSTGGANTLSGAITMTGSSVVGVTTGSTLTASGTVAGDYNLVKTGAGELVLSGAGNSYTGTTTVRQGTLTVAADAPVSANGALGNSSSVVQLGDSSTGGADTIALLSGGAGGVDIDRSIAVNNFGNGTTIGGSNTSGTNTFTGPVTLSRDATLTAATGGTVAFTGGVGGTGAVTKAGGGAVNLTTANTYTGATTVSAGTLQISNGAALGTTAAGTTVSTGATLALTGGVTVASGETVGLSGTGVSSVGALNNVAGDNTVAGAVTLNAATTIGAQAGNLTLSGAVGGANALTTTGAGNIYLTGANTFSGATTIGGTGLVTLSGGALGGTSGLTLNSGSTLVLGASDQINNSANLTLSGGTLRLGGFQDVLNNISLTASTTSIFDYANDNSLLRFAGASAVGASSQLTIDNWAGDPTTGGSTNYGLLFNTQAEALALENNVLFNGWSTLGNNSVIANGSYWEIVPLVTVREWNIANGGNWDTNANWTGSAQPDATGAIALFGNSITAGTSVNVSSSAGGADTEIVGKMLFDTSGGRNYSITGTDRVDFDVASGNAQLIVAGDGQHTISTSGGVRVLDDMTITNDATSTTGLTISSNIDLRNGTNSDLTVAGSGRTVLSGVISNNTAGASLLKTGSGTLALSGANSYTGATTIRNGTIEVAGNAPSALAGNLGNASSAVVLNDSGTALSNNTALLMTDADGGSTVGRAITVNNFGATTTLGGANTSGTNTFSGNIALGKDVDLTAAAGGAVSFTGALSGTGGIEKVGAGAVSLGGTAQNTFTGNVTVTAGTLELAKTGAGVDALPASGNQGAIGDTAAVTIASGANLSINGGVANTLEEIGSLAGDAGANLNVQQATAFTLYTGQNNATTTYAGTLTDSGGNLSLVKQGTGTMTLSGANTYDGDTTVSAGTLVAANNTALGNTTGNTSVSVDATLALSGNITVSAGEDLTLTASATPSTASLANLAGANTYAGVISLAGATSGHDVKIDASAGTQLTLSGVISEATNTKDIFKTGAGTLVLSGSNTGYTGFTTVQGGTLVVSHSNALGAATGAATDDTSVQIGATLAFQNNVTLAAGEALTLNASSAASVASLKNIADTNTVSGDISLVGGVNSGVIIDSNTGTLNLDGAVTSSVFSNNNYLTKTGAGTLALGGATANSFSGAFTINDGVTTAAKTAAGANTATGAGALNIGDGIGASNSAIFQLGASNQINNTTAVTIRTDGKLDLQANTDTIGALTMDGGQVTTTGAGQLTLGGNLTFTGVGSTTAAINGNLDLGGNRIAQIGNNGVGGDSDLTINGAVSGSGFALTKTDLGTLELAGTSANTWTGGTSVNDGTILLNKTAGLNALGAGAVTIGDSLGAADTAIVRLLQNNQIADLAAVTVNSDGRFDLNNQNETVGSIAGSGEIIIGTGQLIAGGNDASTTWSGEMTGGASSLFQKEGAGTLTIASTIDLDGTVNLNAGGLTFDVDNIFTGTVNVLAGATLRLNNADLDITNLNFTGTGVVTLDFAGSASTLNVANLTLSAGVQINIINWSAVSDFFYAQNFAGGVFDTTGVAPMNQIIFNSPAWTYNDTWWQGSDKQVKPVPEPSTYGAMFLGLTGALLGYRRWKKSKQPAKC